MCRPQFPQTRSQSRRTCQRPAVRSGAFPLHANAAVIRCIKVFQGNALITDTLDLTALALIENGITDSEIGHLCSFGLLLRKLLFTEELKHFGKAEAVTEIRCIFAVNGNDDHIGNRQRMTSEIFGVISIELRIECFQG